MRSWSLTLLRAVSLTNCLSFTLQTLVIKNLREKASYFRTLLCLNLFLSTLLTVLLSCFGEIVVITHYGKTLNSIDLVNLMSSISVRFNSFLSLIRFSMNVNRRGLPRLWSVWMDSNHRPRAYQARALTT